jgi:FADH2 O2-dependent halogenase
VNDQRFDVAIPGSGVAGPVLASILGKRGFRVLLETGTHPRFAAGEAPELDVSSVLGAPSPMEPAAVPAMA